MSNIFFDKMVNSNDWFLNWFGSKYYHILYKNRSQNEANNFIRQLVQTLELNPTENVLDLGCGKGRHSNTLSDLFKINFVNSYLNFTVLQTPEKIYRILKIRF